MQAVRLTLRGLRWRSGASLAVLLVAVLASMGAACGPLYSRSAQESLVRDGPGQIAPITSGVIFRGNVDGQTQFSPRQVLDAVSTQASAPTLDPWYRAGTVSLTVLDGSPRIGAHTPGRTQVSWYRGECGAITVTAMISGRLADATQAKLGTIMALGITSNPAADRVQLVGVYDQSTANPAVRGLATPDQFAVARTDGAPDTLDEVIVDQATMLSTNVDVAAISLRTLDASRVHIADLSALKRAVSVATAVRPPTSSGFPADTPGTAATDKPATLAISSLTDYL